jgi:hypothetical protein
MEQLVCALDIQQLVLLNDRLRWLPMVTENVEHLVDDINATEALRVELSSRIATRIGLDSNAPLGELVRIVDPPYAAAWKQHRLHLLGLRAEIDEITSANREVGRRRLANVRETVTALAGETNDTYDLRGVTRPLASASRRFDTTV